MKKLIPFLLILVFLSCADNKPSAEGKFAELSKTEKDSLTEFYHRFSMEFYQPSELHRRVKDTALMISPEHVEYRQRLSYSYKKTGEHIRAMELLNEAVAIDVENNSTAALQYRAWSLLFFYRDYEGAIEDIDQINRMEPKNDYTSCHGEPCNLLKGQALYKLARYEDAIAVFQELLKVEEDKGWDPLDNFHAYFYMARSYSELGEFDKALQLYRTQLARNENFTEAHYQMGKVYNLLDEEEKARPHLEKAQELLAKGFKMGEPYYEAFDEVFLYQVEEELAKARGEGSPLKKG